MKKLNLAIIGQGRSGRDIHGRFLKTENNKWFNVKYIVEADDVRRAKAEKEYDCKTFSSIEGLKRIEDIDLVVNSTYSDEHYRTTKELLRYGFNVLCEKPFTRTRFECDDLIKTAKDNNVLLTVFHQTLIAPYVLKAREVLASGKLGRPQLITIKYNNFARRWDWQTLQKRAAGNLYNTGPHPVGIAMSFLGFGEDIEAKFTYLDRSLVLGDAEDVVKLILTAPGKPVVDIEINSNDAFPDYVCKMQCEKGTFVSTHTDYKMRYIVDGENEDREVSDTFIYTGEDKAPTFCAEELVSHYEEGTLDGDVFAESVGGIYENIYDALTKGAELIVKPEEIARLIGIMEKAHVENPFPVKF